MFRWVTPEEFDKWKQVGLDLGIGVIESGPLVRSSYHADEQSDRFVRKGSKAAMAGAS
jgi:lipoic acid synthetase